MVRSIADRFKSVVQEIDDGFSVSLHLHGHVASNVDPRGFSDPKMPSLYSLRSWVLPR